MTETRLLWNPTEAAFRLGVREQILLDLAAAGDIPHRKIGKAILFHPRELEAWLETLPGTRLTELTSHSDTYSDTPQPAKADLSPRKGVSYDAMPLRRGHSRKALVEKIG